MNVCSLPRGNARWKTVGHGTVTCTVKEKHTEQICRACSLLPSFLPFLFSSSSSSSSFSSSSFFQASPFFLFPVLLLSSRARDINSARLRDIGTNKLCINYAKKKKGGGNTQVRRSNIILRLFHTSSRSRLLLFN